MPARHFRLAALAAGALSLGFALGAVGQATTASSATQHPSGTTGKSASSAPGGTGTTAGGGSTSATAAMGPGAGKLGGGDRSFVEKAAKDGLAEVALAQAAQEKASNAQVKAFARRMQEDHGKANEELKALASAKGLQLPAELDAKHEGGQDKMAKMSGEKFDRESMEHMVKEHRKDVKEFEKQAKGAKDADIKSFAAKTLPTLQEHLKLAQATHDAVKGRGSETRKK